jgi:hypothetical protein
MLSAYTSCQECTHGHAVKKESRNVLHFKFHNASCFKLVFPVLPQDFWFGKSTSFFEQPKLNFSTFVKWRSHLIDLHRYMPCVKNF